MSLPASVLTFALLIASVAESRPARASEPEPGSGRNLIDVPYVPQSEALCGGAAAAMLFRYWGTMPAYAEEFAALVDDSAEGIRLGELTRAIGQRGWRAVAFGATAADVQGHLKEGRPVISLIEDRPGRYHYVVVISWTEGRVVFHDPARGPFRVIAQEEFEQAWSVTGRASLLVLPPTQSMAASSPASGAARSSLRDDADGEPTDKASCGEAVEEAVRLARAGDLESAETLLSLVRESCPSFAAASRELAGIRFLQRRWSDVAAIAEDVTRRDPWDMHAWQLLASARFLGADRSGALRAWNRRGEPRVDLVRIDGLDGVRYQVVADLLNLPPQALLSADQLDRARRRVAEVPALQLSQVGYSPRADGLATIDVAVLERPLLPASWRQLGAAGLRAAATREARLEVASPTGNGELWTTSWRWWANRPRVAFSLVAPRIWRWTGRWRLEGEWERQGYRDVPAGLKTRPTGDILSASERRHVALSFGDWRTNNLRWCVTSGLDHWSARGGYLLVGGSVERRLFRDRLAMRTDGTIWLPDGREAGFGSGVISTAWRSATEGPARWTAQSGLYVASARAPLDLWPRVDIGHLRGALLRAHPLLEDGAIRATALGRVLAHATLEFEEALPAHPAARLRWAAFVDLAKQVRTPAPTSPLQMDVGAGLRAELPGMGGHLRLDVARGIRDGRVALSAAWQAPWPGW